MRLCNICPSEHAARGYCDKHYMQYLRHGKILLRTHLDPNEIIKFPTHYEICLYNKKHQEIARTKISTNLTANILLEFILKGNITTSADSQTWRTRKKSARWRK